MPVGGTIDNGKASTDHPAAGIETIVVNPNDVIKAMRRNNRDKDEQRSHNLRVSPPFEGEKTAILHVSQEGNYYPAEMSYKPIHLPPAAVVVGHMHGSARPEWESHLNFPNRSEARSRFREENDLYGDETGEQLPIAGHDEREAEWEEWWGVTVETWESHVRQVLQTTDEIVLPAQNPEGSAITVDVRLEADDAE
jgi:hypothetical protein